MKKTLLTAVAALTFLSMGTGVYAKDDLHPDIKRSLEKIERMQPYFDRVSKVIKKYAEIELKEIAIKRARAETDLERDKIDSELKELRIKDALVNRN